MTIKRCTLAAIMCFGLVSCGFDDWFEGCGAEADALAAEGLAPSVGARFDFAGLTMPLPQGYLYRIRGDVLELFEAPGVYCDSGDWGVLQEGFVRLQVYKGTVPVDAFSYFPDTHRGYMREQIDYAPVSPLDYSFTHNALTWHVQAYLSGVYHPRVRFMYFRTEIPIDGRHVGLSIHYFPRAPEQAIFQIIGAIDRVVRVAPRADQ